MRLVSPNGVEIEAMEGALDKLISMGFKKPQAKKEEPRPEPKRSAKAKE